MNEAAHEFMMLDAPALLAGTFSAVACALLGNFLVLRRLSLMGDAISHAVLPGLVIAFIVSGMRSPLPMFLGAGISGVVTVAIVELLRKFTRLESGAAMGVTFSVLFALGVLLLRQAVAADKVDLDADCVLYGNLENAVWPGAPTQWADYLRWSTYSFSSATAIPRQVPTLFVTFIIVVVFVLAFYKELRIASFDPSLSTALGFNSTVVHFALMVLVAAATVASFEAVGSILVIAMLICPAATARLLTDKLRTQIVLSGIVAVATGAGGYIAGALLPLWLGFGHSINASGAMAVMAGLLFALAVVGSPSQGIIARHVRRARLATDVAMEDLLARLYRRGESDLEGGLPVTDAEQSASGTAIARRALRRAVRAGLVQIALHRVTLTDKGGRKAARVVRSHRLWETYLVEEMGVRPDHVHDTAMVLEHLRDERATRLSPAAGREKDPHDRPIPPGGDRDQTV